MTRPFTTRFPEAEAVHSPSSAQALIDTTTPIGKAHKMKILIDIKTDNLPNAPEDCARILRKLADSLIVHGDAIDDPGLLSALYDINGNCVGAVEVVDDELREKLRNILE